MPNGRDCVPAGSLADPVRHDPLAAPGCEDDIRGRSDHGLRGDEAVPGRRSVTKLRKDVLAPGDLDELRDPANPADQRIVPLLEIDPIR